MPSPTCGLMCVLLIQVHLHLRLHMRAPLPPHLLEHTAAEVDDRVDATELLEHKQQAAHQHALPIGRTEQALAASC